MNVKSPFSLVVVSRPTPVAWFTSVTFTPLTTAPVGSMTRPNIRPPVLWPKAETVKRKSASTTTDAENARPTVGEDIKCLQAACEDIAFYGQKFPLANLAIIRQG